LKKKQGKSHSVANREKKKVKAQEGKHERKKDVLVMEHRASHYGGKFFAVWRTNIRK